MLRKMLSFITLACFVLTSVVSPAAAQGISLPGPQEMIGLTAPVEPCILRGLKLDPADPLRFNFIVDGGDEGLAGDGLQEESDRLIRYFLAVLTTPDTDLWVNLSPYENDRIIEESLGRTALGRDMLAQDYILKQLTASLMHPDSTVGKKFWAEVYRRAYEKFGSTDIPVNTFHKVWITPDRTAVHEGGGAGGSVSVYIDRAHLKVMLETDYLAARQADRHPEAQSAEGSQHPAPLNDEIATAVMREIVIPVIEKEVNEGAHFAPLRKFYHSLLLAVWMKRKMQHAFNPLADVYIDRHKTNGVEIRNPKDEVEGLYKRYVEAFRKGVYDLVREDTDVYSQELIPRKYFSGGLTLGSAAQSLEVQTGDISPAQHLQQIVTADLTAAEEDETPLAAGQEVPLFSRTYGRFPGIFSSIEIEGKYISAMALAGITENIIGLIRSGREEGDPEKSRIGKGLFSALNRSKFTLKDDQYPDLTYTINDALSYFLRESIKNGLDEGAGNTRVEVTVRGNRVRVTVHDDGAPIEAPIEEILQRTASPKVDRGLIRSSQGLRTIRNMVMAMPAAFEAQYFPPVNQADGTGQTTSIEFFFDAAQKSGDLNFERDRQSWLSKALFWPKMTALTLGVGGFAVYDLQVAYEVQFEHKALYPTIGEVFMRDFHTMGYWIGMRGAGDVMVDPVQTVSPSPASPSEAPVLNVPKVLVQEPKAAAQKPKAAVPQPNVALKRMLGAIPKEDGRWNEARVDARLAPGFSISTVQGMLRAEWDANPSLQVIFKTFDRDEQYFWAKAYHETKIVPTSIYVNDNGSHDFGLWQFNTNAMIDQYSVAEFKALVDHLSRMTAVSMPSEARDALLATLNRRARGADQLLVIKKAVMNDPDKGGLTLKDYLDRAVRSGDPWTLEKMAQGSIREVTAKAGRLLNKNGSVSVYDLARYYNGGEKGLTYTNANSPVVKYANAIKALAEAGLDGQAGLARPATLSSGALLPLRVPKGLSRPEGWVIRHGLGKGKGSLPEYKTGDDIAKAVAGGELVNVKVPDGGPFTLVLKGTDGYTYPFVNDELAKLSAWFAKAHPGVKVQLTVTGAVRDAATEERLRDQLEGVAPVAPGQSAHSTKWFETGAYTAIDLKFSSHHAEITRQFASSRLIVHHINEYGGTVTHFSLGGMRVQSRQPHPVKKNTSNPAQNVGGIDLNPAMVDMMLQDGKAVDFKFTPEQLKMLEQNLTGFVPVIVGTTPVSDIAAFLR